LDFGPVPIDESSDLRLTVSFAGDGTQALEIQSVEVLNAGGVFRVGRGADASGTALSPFQLADGDSTALTVRYTPDAAGEHRATISIVSNAANEPIYVPVLGTGIYGGGPAINITPNSHDYGSWPMGSRGSVTFQIRNGGTGPLALGNPFLQGDTAFSLVNAPDVVGRVLAPTESVGLVVKFGPYVDREFEGSVSVLSNDPARPVVQIGLEGEGSVPHPYPICRPVVISGAVWLGAERWDGTPLQQATLSGSYSLSLDFDASQLDHEWRLLSQPDGSAVSFAPTVAPSVIFLPDVAGDYEFEVVATDPNGRESDPCLLILEAIPDDELWVEMFWSEPDEDMDLHLVLNSGALGSTQDCHWSNCVGGLEWGEPGPDDNPSLDQDDIPGTGPENISILEPGPAAYQVYVRDFPGADNGLPNPTTVRIHIDGLLAVEYQSTDDPNTANFGSLEGSYWYVATVTWPDRTITPRWTLLNP
jgi:hypothetical protein